MELRAARVRAKIRQVRPCTNDPVAKSIEIRDAIAALGSGDSCDRLQTLFAVGAFRHLEDVAYARIMLHRGQTVDEIARYLALSDAERVRGDLKGAHQLPCDPAWPHDVPNKPPS